MRLSILCPTGRRDPVARLAGFLYCGFVIVLAALCGAAPAQDSPSGGATEPQGSGQLAFPHYYNAGLPNEDDLVHFADPPAKEDNAVVLPPSLEKAEVPQAAFPDIYAPALLQQSKTTLDAEITRARAAFNLIKSFCEAEETDEAWEVYSTMPAFADNLLINDYRAEAASLLILALGRERELPRARVVYDSLPAEIPGETAMLAKARSIINLTTHYVIDNSYNEAFAVLMDIEAIEEREELNSELFKLMSRMIPYLDNADESEKAYAVYHLLLKQVKDAETAKLFAENLGGLPRYFLQYALRIDSAEKRERRIAFLHHIFDSLAPLADNADIQAARLAVAGALFDFHIEAGEPGKAKRFYDVMQGGEAKASTDSQP